MGKRISKIQPESIKSCFSFVSQENFSIDRACSRAGTQFAFVSGQSIESYQKYFSNEKKELTSVTSPIFFNLLLDYFNGRSDLTTALIYALLICSTNLLYSLIVTPRCFYAERYSTQIRAAVCGLVYRKVWFIIFWPKFSTWDRKQFELSLCV